MGRIACITDRAGRVQHQRMCMLSKHIGDCDVFTLGSRKTINWKKYSLAYYSNYSLLKRVPCDIRKICSITSHKSLDSLKGTLKLLKHFKAVSVNNTYLKDAFYPHLKKKLRYIPNGVDTELFCPDDRKRESEIRIGWAGNRDRKTKNYHLFRAARKIELPVHFDGVVTKKRDVKLHKSREQMRDFYRNLDFFLITSSTEGTPNPGLEALSCGVPVITTKVGNMVEIVKDGYNGFFIEPNRESMFEAIHKIVNLSSEAIAMLGINARNSIVDDKWDWSYRMVPWLSFFEDYRR